MIKNHQHLRMRIIEPCACDDIVLIPMSKKNETPTGSLFSSAGHC
jgi:hypothetical protein